MATDDKKCEFVFCGIMEKCGGTLDIVILIRKTFHVSIRQIKMSKGVGVDGIPRKSNNMGVRE